MLEDYRSDLVDFSTAWMREQYLFLSGQKPGLEIAPIYERYGDLFTLDSIARLRRILEDTPEHFGTERVAVRRLLLFASEQFLEFSAKELTERISAYEAGTMIDVGGRVMTFQQAAVSLRTEPDRQSRRAIFRARAGAIEASNDLRAEHLGILYTAARKLGYDSYTGIYEDLWGLDYRALATQAGALLSETEEAYTANLDEALRLSLDLRLDEAERADALYFLHLTPYDEYFPADDLLRVYKETLASLGIDVDEQTNIVFDSEARPHKTARAFCMPISVPEEIKLVIHPMGGQTDYQTLLHEAGHAQHYAWTSPNLRAEFKYTGDYALTECYAFLFNHLISNSVWLAEMLGFGGSREFSRQVMLTRLLQARRYVAKLNYECELHTGADLEQAPRRYAEIQTRATGFETEPGEFLFDLDDSFYSANYVRAWAFEVILRDHLMTRFGSYWWRSRRAGRFLKEMWELGDRYTADEMALLIGIGPITFGPLIEELKQALK